MDADEAAIAAEKEFALAMVALAVEDSLTALVHLERALKLRDNPGWYSYLGYCIAKERGQHRQGLELCQKALDREPDHPIHYGNLGKLYLLAGDRLAALRVLREGMAKCGNPELLQQLERLGMRKTPPLAFLPRSNPLNKYLGLLLTKIGMR